MAAHRTPSRLRPHRLHRLDWQLFVDGDADLAAEDERLRQRGFVRHGPVRVTVGINGSATYRFAWRQTDGDMHRWHRLTIKVTPA